MHHAYLIKQGASGSQIFYSLHLSEDMFSGWTVVREWGIVGSEGRVMTSLVPCEESAFNAMTTTIKGKVRDGYKILVPRES